MALLLSNSILFSGVANASGVKAAVDGGNAASTPLRQGDAIAGKLKSEDERCQECHGSDGNGNRPEGKFAKLAGQYPEHMLKQLRNYRTGERKYEFMSMMVNTIDDADLADIAAYYAKQSKMHGDGTGNNAVGRNLFVNGDAGRNILPCVSCHDAGGASSGNIRNPVLGGQERNYLEKQIIAWRNGERHNSTDAIMNNITKSLTDNEIQALANYLSGL